MINLLSGSGEAIQAASRLSSAVNEPQDASNLPFEFQFLGQGRITGGSDDRWLIGNVPIQVGEYTRLSNDLHPEDFVTLSGRILEDGTWLADRIELAQEGEAFFTFNGPLEWVRGIAWRIGGITLLTDLETSLGSDLMVSDLLLATFAVRDNGVWLAMEIKAFDRFPLEPTPIPTATETPTKTATPTSEPTAAPIENDAPPPAPEPNPAENAENTNEVTICHKPGGNAKAAHTLVVGGAALQEHLNHGDTLGACP